MDLGPCSKAGQVTGSVRPNGKGRLMAGEGDAEQEPEQAAEAEGVAARALPAPPQPTPEMVASHNVSHIPFRSWCAHCVRGRGKSFFTIGKFHARRTILPSRPSFHLITDFLERPGKFLRIRLAEAKCQYSWCVILSQKVFLPTWFRVKGLNIFIQKLHY